ncbi:hypothetical protein BV898_18637 [Hypsibius exemplaris]|uniref:Uncharacterized protein n=1 Tax=Hypsibius exemplaris TaxID=2072580 RepID=A0A9X6NK12_HYPEX|nr:hypothetical protein BV898_18637 [Hypsibius exemplaris]
MPKARVLAPKTFVASDPERNNCIPQSFLGLLNGSQKREDIVVFEYGEDKVIELVLPSKLTIEKVRPRFTAAMLKTYSGKDCLEVGMFVHLFWSRNYDRCPATVVGVGNYEDMNNLFKELTAGHKTGNKVKKPPSLRKQSAKATIADKALEKQQQRQTLIADELFGDQDNDGEEELVELEDYVAEEDREENGLDIIEWLPSDAEKIADAEDETAEPEETETAAGKESGMSLTKIDEKIAFYAKKLQKFKRLRSLELPAAKKAKLVVPDFKWTFEMDGEATDTAIYKRFSRDSAIWINKQLLLALQKNSKNQDRYQRKLMWELLVPYAEIKRVLPYKSDSIGFVKFFGRNNIDSVYKHLVNFRHSKKSDGPEWLIEMKSKSDLTKEWTKSFAGRIARLKAALHAENRIDEAADWGAD